VKAGERVSEREEGGGRGVVCLSIHSMEEMVTGAQILIRQTFRALLRC